MPAPKGVPHHKPTKDEGEQIQAYVITLLGRMKRPGEIKKDVANLFGLEPRSVERYLSRARKEMRTETGKDKAEHRTDALYFYRSILEDNEASHRDKIRARERIDKLLAIDLPSVVHGENVNLNIDITPEQLAGMTDEELADHKRRLLN